MENELLQPALCPVSWKPVKPSCHTLRITSLPCYPQTLQKNQTRIPWNGDFFMEPLPHSVGEFTDIPPLRRRVRGTREVHHSVLRGNTTLQVTFCTKQDVTLPLQANHLEPVLFRLLVCYLD